MLDAVTVYVGPDYDLACNTRSIYSITVVTDAMHEDRPAREYLEQHATEQLLDRMPAWAADWCRERRPFASWRLVEGKDDDGEPVISWNYKVGWNVPMEVIDRG